MLVGSLVAIISGNAYNPQVRGYDSFPGEYGFHCAVWVNKGATDVVVASRDDFRKVFVGGKMIWFERFSLQRIQ